MMPPSDSDSDEDGDEKPAAKPKGGQVSALHTHLAFSNALAPSESCRSVKTHLLDAAQVLTYYVLMCS